MWTARGCIQRIRCPSVPGPMLARIASDTPIEVPGVKLQSEPLTTLLLTEAITGLRPTPSECQPDQNPVHTEVHKTDNPAVDIENS